MGGYNDDLVMSRYWTLGSELSSSKTRGIELTKKSLSYFSSNEGVYSNNTNQNDSWNMNVGKETEKLDVTLRLNCEDKNIYKTKKTFSSNVIVRNVGGRKLKVTDTSRIQTNPKASLVDRYTKLYTSYAGTSGYNYSLYQKTQRLGLFRDYEAMDVDPIIASALDIYADESTMKSEYGDVLNITSDNNDLKDILHNLFYDILNIEFNLWLRVRNMVKYGDFFLKLEIMKSMV